MKNALLLGLSGLVLSTLTFAMAPAKPAQAPMPMATAQPQELWAGFSERDITPPIGVPLAGYGDEPRRNPNPLQHDKYNTYLKASIGKLDPIRAKVLVLKKGDSKLAFISMDVVGITPEFRASLLDRVSDLGFKPNEIMISATHTHSGPGTLSPSLFWAIFATDAFKREIYDQVVTKLSFAVKDALGRAEPAELFSGQFDAVGIQKNRRHHPGLFDSKAHLLLVRSKSAGAWLGSIVNFALHGTGLGQENLLFSADIPGRIETLLQARLDAMNGETLDVRPTVLFINGAEGDVIPVDDGKTDIQAVGKSFVQQAEAAFSDLKKIEPNWSVRSSEVTLGKAAWNFRACDKYGIKSGFPQDILFKSVPDFFSESARIWTIQLGSVLMMTWPGEPITVVGNAMKQIGRQSGAEETWVLGLTNDHLGYFLMPEDYAEDGYEACVNFYGGDAALKILAVQKELLR